MEKKKFELDFDEYIRHAEPSKQETSSAWSTAIGLQQVDGLVPSKYLFDTARRNIEGDITIDEVQKLIDSYYESKAEHNDEDETEEADKVSARIAKILCEKSFNFSPSYLIAIHRELFLGIYKFAGRIRDYDISKKEWVLNGASVMYGAAFELKTALDYDFEQERHFIYAGLSMDRIVEHLAYFISRLWQIHAFGEGNTRTTAVFTIQYLRSLGFKVSNDIFAKNSWYFRNALVRANYKNLQKGIDKNPEFLEKFFRNMLIGEHNELKNRFLHLDFKAENPNIDCKNANINYQNANIEFQRQIANAQKKALLELVRTTKLNATREKSILRIIEKIDMGQVFGASDVMKAAGCKRTAASLILAQMLELKLTEKVIGHGKGKYRFKEYGEEK